MICRTTLPVGLLFVLPVVAHVRAEDVSDGLVLHMDAQMQVDATDRHLMVPVGANSVQSGWPVLASSCYAD